MSTEKPSYPGCRLQMADPEKDGLKQNMTNEVLVKAAHLQMADPEKDGLKHGAVVRLGQGMQTSNG